MLKLLTGLRVLNDENPFEIGSRRNPLAYLGLETDSFLRIFSLPCCLASTTLLLKGFRIS